MAVGHPTVERDPNVLSSPNLNEIKCVCVRKCLRYVRTFEKLYQILFSIAYKNGTKVSRLLPKLFHIISTILLNTL